MRRLNNKGVSKVIPLLKGKYNISGNVIQGKICSEDRKIMLDINVLAEEVDNECYHLLHEQDDVEVTDAGEEDQLLDNQEKITKPKEPIDTIDGEEQSLTPTEIRNLITQLVPHLNNYYATKDEINEVLNDLRKQMIDPQEWIEMFKGLGNKIKKQSRPDDEVG